MSIAELVNVHAFQMQRDKYRLEDRVELLKAAHA